MDAHVESYVPDNPDVIDKLNSTTKKLAEHFQILDETRVDILLVYEG